MAFKSLWRTWTFEGATRCLQRLDSLLSLEPHCRSFVRPHTVKINCKNGNLSVQTIFRLLSALREVATNTKWWTLAGLPEDLVFGLSTALESVADIIQVLDFDRACAESDRTVARPFTKMCSTRGLCFRLRVRIRGGHNPAHSRNFTQKARGGLERFPERAPYFLVRWVEPVIAGWRSNCVDA
ncbi:hypothetical protein M427DRAFT_58953 [Gonapodya prolifera JEL478]|uniref:Uncharacterized protein n=1 Tax=Gonapodya prolifera (strain JEL478) TaxID=1344416 RepID=A0A139A8I1_GONPJ|nr:hypothetical protein M427DRAFT_58953 [Gonapodya prolifera JEL478]|eukprot:KXS13037.1 hypothetical protein M427DRAFT_58953 [Gonapodya prolifera JEL478]